MEDEDSISTSVALILQGCKTGVRILAERLLALDRTSPVHDQLSLCQLDGGIVTLVKWYTLLGYPHGQRVRAPFGRVIYPMSMPGREPVVNMAESGVFLITTETRTNVEKERKNSNRPIVPADIIGLEQRWKVGLADDLALCDKCCICSGTVALRTCPLCLCTMHVACIEATAHSHWTN